MASKSPLIVTPDDLVVIDLICFLEASEKAFYGAPLILDGKSVDHTVLYGVARDLLRLRKRLGIKHAICLIGREAKSISGDLTVKNVVRFLRNLGVTVVYEPQATAASLCRDLAVEARWVVTKNRILFQFVTDDVEVLVPNLEGRGMEVVTVESLKVSLGIRPDQIPSFLALTEGEKTALFTERQAARLLELHDDLGRLLQNTSVISSEHLKRHLSANKKMLLRSLADFRLDPTRHLNVKKSKLAFIEDEDCASRVLREYGFWSLIHVLPRSKSTGVYVSATVERRDKYKAIRNEAGMQEMVAVVSKSEVCAIDTEATDKDPRTASLLGVAFAVKEGEAFYVPLAQTDLQGTSTEAIRERLRGIFAGRTGFVGHNIKFDYVLLRQHGITIHCVSFDTMLAAYDCFGDCESFSLAALAKKLLGKDIKKYQDIVGKRETLLDVPFNELLEHACTDADVTLQLYHRLKKELKKRSLLEQFSGDTMALLRVLTDRECNGVRLNPRALHRKRKLLAAEAELLKRAVMVETGREFDLDSPTETATALREICPPGELIGRRVSLSQLEQLGGTHRIPRLIVKYSRAQKLARELEAISQSIKDTKVFPIFTQVRWAHGCLSSTDPRICGPDGPLPATAILDGTIRERMDNSDRSLSILQKASRDEALRRDMMSGSSGRHRISGKYAILRDVDQKDLLLSVAIGLSDAALSRRFLIDRLLSANIRQAAEQRYSKLFEWLNTYRRAAMSQGFACHDGKLKYLEGLKSSNIDKRHKALVSALRWTIRY